VITAHSKKMSTDTHVIFSSGR